MLLRCVIKTNGRSGCWEDGANGFRGGLNLNWTVKRAVLFLLVEWVNT